MRSYCLVCCQNFVLEPCWLMSWGSLGDFSMSNKDLVSSSYSSMSFPFRFLQCWVLPWDFYTLVQLKMSRDGIHCLYAIGRSQFISSKWMANTVLLRNVSSSIRGYIDAELKDCTIFRSERSDYHCALGKSSNGVFSIKNGPFGLFSASIYRFFRQFQDIIVIWSLPVTGVARTVLV